MTTNTHIRFDWAMKRLLRDKANFAILEGLISTLLEQKIKIIKLLESESNKYEADTKANRVDILAETECGEMIIVEVQNRDEFAYFQRILFGTSKVVSEYIKEGDNYSKVRKIYSISIIYFGLGENADTVYKGTTEFRGIHNNDLLQLTQMQQEKFKAEAVSDIFPVYYILNVSGFNKVSREPLEQWLYFLSNSAMPDVEITAPGLSEAKEAMRLIKMPSDERKKYSKHLLDLASEMDSNTYPMKKAYFEGEQQGLRKGREEGLSQGLEQGLLQGREEGLARGLSQGREEGAYEAKLETACKLKSKGFSSAEIAEITGLSMDEIEKA